MGDQYRLVGLGNSELLAKLSALVQQSNVLTAQLLAHLVELEERTLHLELGFSSLFSYCVEALGMSEGAAGRRVAAVRVCRRFSGVFERVARGELHLCALCALAPHLTDENARELFDACRRKTRRQVEELLAIRFPRPDVKEQIRRLPTRPLATTAVANEARPRSHPVEPCPTTPCALQSAETARTRQVPAASNSPSLPTASTALLERRRHAREIEPLSSDRFGVHFTADAELRDLIERARALARHRLANGDLASLVKLMAASFVQQEEKRRFGVAAMQRQSKMKARHEDKASPENQCTRVPVMEPMPQTTSEAKRKEPQPHEGRRRPTPPGEVPTANAHASEMPQCVCSEARPAARAAPGSKSGRYLSVTVRRDVHARDHAQCAFVSAGGRRCNARAFLQFDHIEPFARGGAANVPNIRLPCWAHNRLHARRCFGALHLAAKTAARRRAKRATPSSELAGLREGSP